MTRKHSQGRTSSARFPYNLRLLLLFFFYHKSLFCCLIYFPCEFTLFFHPVTLFFAFSCPFHALFFLFFYCFSLFTCHVFASPCFFPLNFCLHHFFPPYSSFSFPSRRPFLSSIPSLYFLPRLFFFFTFPPIRNLFLLRY